MKKVLITGGSRGIGAACVRRFCAEGCKVSFIYNKSEADAEALASETGAVAICADISDKIQLETAIADATKCMGGIDVLVNNAGVSLIALLSDTDDTALEHLLSVNLTAAIVAAREVSRYMVREHCGYIINIGSVWGRIGASCEALYSASKAGLRGFTLALAKELGYSGVRVNCVEPGVIDTDMNRELGDDDISELVERTPLSRIGKPKEVAEAVYWLCSGKADFITGQILGVDGGFGL